LQDKFKVGGIHIGIGQDDLASQRAFGCKMGKSRRDAGFARSAFAAENNELFHGIKVSNSGCFSASSQIGPRCKNPNARPLPRTTSKRSPGCIAISGGK
jgi:hypothetical protein